MHPTDEFMSLINSINNAFCDFHGEYLSKESNIFYKLTKLVMKDIDPKWPEEVIACFVRTRKFIRVKSMNCLLKDDINGRQLKKKLKKLRE